MGKHTKSIVPLAWPSVKHTKSICSRCLTDGPLFPLLLAAEDHEGTQCNAVEARACRGLAERSEPV